MSPERRVIACDHPKLGSDSVGADLRRRSCSATFLWPPWLYPSTFQGLPPFQGSPLQCLWAALGASTLHSTQRNKPAHPCCPQLPPRPIAHNWTGTLEMGIFWQSLPREKNGFVIFYYFFFQIVIPKAQNFTTNILTLPTKRISALWRMNRLYSNFNILYLDILTT